MSKRKHRIIHLQVLPLLSGVQKSMVDIITRLDDSQYDITVLCQGEGQLTQALERHNIKFITLPELRREINPYYDFLAFVKLYRLFRKEKFDLVHTHSTKPGIIGRLAAWAAGIKCVVHTVQGFAFHEHSPKLQIFLVAVLERLAGLASQKVIFVNSKDREVASKLNLVPPHKIVTIYNGIDLRQFNGSNGKNGLKRNGATVAMIARLWKQKAPQDYIASIPYVIDQQPDAKFLVVGDGPLENELKQMSVRLGVSQNVVFLGWQQDITRLLHNIDVFVLPSLWEGLPVSILEAMAAAKPVIATNIKGNNELVVHGETGYLVEPNNPGQIGAHLLKMLNDSDLAKKMGRQGYLRVKTHFELAKTVKQTQALYQSLLC
ncbi:MAG: glycosyltransferase family 4 protein [bacterium]